MLALPTIDSYFVAIEGRVFFNAWNCGRATIPASVLFNYLYFLEMGPAVINPNYETL